MEIKAPHRRHIKEFDTKLQRPYRHKTWKNENVLIVDLIMLDFVKTKVQAQKMFFVPYAGSALIYFALSTQQATTSQSTSLSSRAQSGLCIVQYINSHGCQL